MGCSGPLRASAWAGNCLLHTSFQTGKRGTSRAYLQRHFILLHRQAGIPQQLAQVGGARHVTHGLVHCQRALACRRGKVEFH